MGLPTFAREELKSKYGNAFDFKRPGDPTVIVYDLMKDVKFMPTNPKDPQNSVNTLDDAIFYCTNKIKHLLHNRQFRVRVIVVCVDRKPPPVKRMVVHTKRYKKKNVFKAEDGKAYLPERLTDLIPNPWIQFAGNYKLLQREFYPRLFNAFMDGHHIVPEAGQMIVLHGFPGKTEYVPMYSQKAYMDTDDRGFVAQVHMWKESTELPIRKQVEKDDPDLYNRIYVIENVLPGGPVYPDGGIVKREWEEAKNSISESDGAMFYYDHWFQNETIMFVCNDGDIFAYGLLYAFERVQKNNTFRNLHIGMLPYKSKKALGMIPENKRPKWEFVDFNKLYILVAEDPILGSAGVQNHELTVAFLLIMAESDFFKDYMKGIGKENIWKTFFNCIGIFSHMVQMSKGVERDTRTYREVVLDEDLFRLFIYYCYIDKYGTSARARIEKEDRKQKRRKVDDSSTLTRDPLTYDQLRLHCSLGKKAQSDPDYKLPDRNTIRNWGRKVLWNIRYYKNVPLGKQDVPNPFAMWDGLPFYPFIINPDTGKYQLCDEVSARAPPVDEVFRQHMYAEKLSRNNTKKKKRDREEATMRQQEIINMF